jgi:hypothetical protein
MTLLYPAQWRGRRAVETESPEGWDSASCAAKRGLPPIPAFGIGWLYPVCLGLILRPSRPRFSSPRMRCFLITRLISASPRLGGGKHGLSRKCQIRAYAAKRGLPPIPAFGIGWLYPVCLLQILRLSRPLFSSPRMRCFLITRLISASPRLGGEKHGLFASPRRGKGMEVPA